MIPWILDQVEDDKRGGGVIIPLPMVIAKHVPYYTDTGWQSGGGFLLSFLRMWESRVVGMTLLSLRGSRQAWPKQSGGGVEKVNFAVIPASAREYRDREIGNDFKKIHSREIS